MEWKKLRGVLFLGVLSMILTATDGDGNIYHHNAKRTLTQPGTDSGRLPSEAREVTMIRGPGFIMKGEEIPRSSRNACQVKLKCKLSEMSPNTITSVRLIFNQQYTGGPEDGVVLAEYNPVHERPKFQDVTIDRNKGVLNSHFLPRGCTIQQACDDATTYLINPVMDRDLGEYTCEMKMDNGTGPLLTYIGSTIVKYTTCCPRCSQCDLDHWGVWGEFTDWPALTTSPSHQRRGPVGCLTNNCSSPAPVETRRCFQDGTCDTSENIRIFFFEEDPLCSAVIQCGTMEMCGSKISSVKLYHKTAERAGKGRLLAKAKRGVSRGRFQRVANVRNGHTANNQPDMRHMCAGLMNCFQYYAFYVIPVLATDAGQYTCEISAGGRVMTSTATLHCPSQGVTDISQISDKTLCRLLCTWNPNPSPHDPSERELCSEACEHPEFVQSMLALVPR